jgi:hypothetical protein
LWRCRALGTSPHREPGSERGQSQPAEPSLSHGGELISPNDIGVVCALVVADEKNEEPKK